MEEEEQWNIEDAEIDADDLSDSGEESEEHDSDNVVFYSDMDDDDDEEDEDRGSGPENDIFSSSPKIIFECSNLLY